jgi:uncharacterized membrane protein
MVTISKETGIMRFENCVLIHQPIEKVFEFVTDVMNNPKWQTDILEIQITSAGPIGFGSTFRCVNRFMGLRFETKSRITVFVPDRACTFQIESENIAGESHFQFERVNGGTRFTAMGTLDLGFFKFTQGIVKHQINRQLRKDMSTLKHVLENGGQA